MKQKEYLHALAHHEKYDKKQSVTDRIWLFHKLGLYASVAQMRAPLHSWRVMYAYVVAFAALGKLRQAELILYRLQKKSRFLLYARVLAHDLAPYAPRLAIEVLEKTYAKTLVLPALYYRVGAHEKGRRLLGSLEKKYAKHPEFLLLKSNFENVPDREKLHMLNRYLAYYGLSSVSLRKSDASLNVTNLHGQRAENSDQGVPVVTILMTTYNLETHIESSVNSLLNQTYGNIELIIVDDKSEDGTREKLLELAKRDNRVKTLFLEENVGTYVAKTVGLHNSTGAFVICHDGDDWAHPQKIEEQVRPLLSNPRLVCTTSNWVRMDERGNYYARASYPLLRHNPSSVMFRKEAVLQKTGAWDLVRTGADSEFFARLKLLFGSQSILKIKKPLTFGAHRENSLMTSEETGHCADSISSDRLAYWESWHRWHMAQVQCGKLPVLSMAEHMEERKFFAPEAIVIDPEKIRKVLGSQ